MQAAEADRIAQELWDFDVTVWKKYWAPIFTRFARSLALAANLKPGQIILDVGTGTGVAAFEAGKRLNRGFVIGIDRSPQMIKIADTTKTKLNNISFIRMNGDQMLFPNKLFDRVLSNCGISYGTFQQTISEIHRVMQSHGEFIYTDWHLIDVPPHRTFSEILRRHRTDHPSPKLRKWREALSTLESLGNQYSESRKQELKLESVGFRNVSVRTRTYRIFLRDIRAYLKMRLDRAPLKQELIELTPTKRTELMNDLRTGLRCYVRKNHFKIDWKVNFIRAVKP